MLTNLFILSSFYSAAITVEFFLCRRELKRLERQLENLESSDES